MDPTQDEDMKIAEDFRRQLQERFPTYEGDRGKIDVASAVQSNVAKLQSAIDNLRLNSEKDLLDAVLRELEDTSLPNPQTNQ